MSVVLVTDGMSTVEGVLATFRRQTIADRIELVVAHGPGAEMPDDVGAGFARCTVLSVADPFEISAARAECVAAATAPIVAIGETHCLPEPRWCEVLLAHFEDPDVAIAGSRVLCANPLTTLAQAAHLLDYGPWAQGPAERRRHLPAHNVAYRRDLLVALGSDLAPSLDVDTGLNAHFLEQGKKLVFEPAAVAHHLNVSQPRPWLRERVINGRAYAGLVGRTWPWPRRVAYGLAWPLIALVRLARLAPIAAAAGISRRAAPATLLALLLASAGEGAGFLAGPGEASRYRRRLEIEKGSYLRPGEASTALRRVLALA